jgi:hypothetical protein
MAAPPPKPLSVHCVCPRRGPTTAHYQRPFEFDIIRYYSTFYSIYLPFDITSQSRRAWDTSHRALWCNASSTHTHTQTHTIRLQRFLHTFTLHMVHAPYAAASPASHKHLYSRVSQASPAPQALRFTGVAGLTGPAQTPLFTGVAGLTGPTGLTVHKCRRPHRPRKNTFIHGCRRPLRPHRPYGSQVSQASQASQAPVAPLYSLSQVSQASQAPQAPPDFTGVAGLTGVIGLACLGGRAGLTAPSRPPEAWPASRGRPVGRVEIAIFKRAMGGCEGWGVSANGNGKSKCMDAWRGLKVGG